MPDRTLLIVGGGLGGLAAGCYARMNGWRTRIFEHGLTAGGACTSWRRGDYVLDSGVPWIAGGAPGGALRDTLEELGVVPAVTLRPLALLARFEHPEGWAVDVGSDLAALRRDLAALSPGDAVAVDRLLAAVESAAEPTLRQRIALRGSVAEWCARHLRGARLVDLLTHLVPPETPVVTFTGLLGQLAAGQLVRPIGGAGALRDALVARYRELGGELTTHVTVDEILILDGRATGIRLDDGTQARGDAVVTTASAFETIQRLLGGRHGDGATWDRLARWPTTPPSLLVQLGVSLPLDEAPPALLLRQAVPFTLGGPEIDVVEVRTSVDDPTLAPPGHAVVQARVPTSWDHWADAGDGYHVEKARARARILERLEPRFPGIGDAVEVSDVATPISFWRYARAWRGAAGWLATVDSAGTRPAKKLASVGRLYFAGRWVEPGGGAAASLLSGRQAAELLCADVAQPFVLAPRRDRFSEARTS